MTKHLGIIPARAGSKRIPKKNVKNFAGKPLISHSIEQGLQASGMDIVVTSDSHEALEIARNSKVPYIRERPAALAEDSTGMADVIQDVLNWLGEKVQHYESLSILQPTSPFRKSQDIDSSIDALVKNNVHSVVGISQLWQHPFDVVKTQNFREWNYLAKPESKTLTRTQDYDQDYYFINGAIYTVRIEKFLECQKFVFENETYLMKMDVCNSIDIDNDYEWIAAEALFKHFTGVST